LRLSLYCSAGYSHFAMFKASFRGGRGCASPTMLHHTQQRRLYCTNVRILLREWNFYLGMRQIPNATCNALSYAQLRSYLVVEKPRDTLICQTVTGCQELLGHNYSVRQQTDVPDHRAETPAFAIECSFSREVKNRASRLRCANNL
jgi:hypothetical protein